MRDRTQRRLTEKAASELNPGRGPGGAFQVKRWGVGSTSGEEGVVLLLGHSLRGWGSGVQMVLWACLPGKHSLESQAKGC